MSGVAIQFEEQGGKQTQRTLEAINKRLITLVKNSRSVDSIFGSFSEKGLDNIRKSTNKTSYAFRNLKKDSVNALDKTSVSAIRTNAILHKIKNTALAIGAIFISIKSTSAFTKIGDDLLNIQNRLRLVVNSTTELIKLQTKLHTLSRNTRADLASTASVYVDLSQGMERFGLSQKRTLNLVKTIQQAAAMSGSSMESIKAGLVQLGQGLSGELRGQELRSVYEQLKYLGLGMGKVLNKSMGEMIKYAEGGNLAGKKLISVLEEMAAKTSEDFAKTSATVDQSLTQMLTSFRLFFGDLNQYIRLNEGIANRFLKFADLFKGLNTTFVAQLTAIRQHIKNFINEILLFDSFDFSLKSIIDFTISPLDSFAYHRFYNKVKRSFIKIQNFTDSQNPFLIKAKTDISIDNLLDGVSEKIKRNLFPIQEFFIDIGLLKQRLIQLNALSFSKLISSIRDLRAGLQYTYEELFAAHIQAMLSSLNDNLQKEGKEFVRTIGYYLNEQSGERLANSFIKGIKKSFSLIDGILNDLLSGQSIFKNLFESSELIDFKKGVITTFKSLGGFIKGFYSTLFKQIFSKFNFSSEFVQDIQHMLATIKEVLSNLFDKTFGKISSLKLKYKLSFDYSDFKKAILKLHNMFKKFIKSTQTMLTKVFKNVKQFGEGIKGVFFDIYDKVVGHSYWPDTMNGIEEETKPLDNTLNILTSFKNSVVSIFKSIFATPTFFENLSDTFKVLTNNLLNLDFQNIFNTLKNKLGASILAAILWVKGDFSAKLFAVNYFASMFLPMTEGVASSVGPVLARELGKIGAEAGAMAGKGLKRGIFVALNVLPKIVNGFFSSLFGNSNALVGFFNKMPEWLQDIGKVVAFLISPLSPLLTLFTNDIVKSLAIIGGAWALFRDDGRKTISELIFGRKSSRGKSARNGIIQYLTATLPALNVMGGWVGRKIFESRGFLAAAIGAFSLSISDSISFIDASMLGTPLLMFALFGKDGGALILKSLRTFLAGPLLSVLHSAGVMLNRKFNFSSILGGKGKRSNFKQNPFIQKFRDYFSMYQEAFFNFKRNVQKPNAKNISIMRLFEEGERGTTGRINRLNIRAANARLFASILDAKVGNSTIRKNFSKLKVSLTSAKDGIILFMKDFARGIVSLSIGMFDGIKQFALLAGKLIVDGYSFLVNIIKSKFMIFSIIGLLSIPIFSGIANAATNMEGSFKSLSDILTTFLKVVLTLIPALIGIGIAVRTFGLFKSGKLAFIEEFGKGASGANLAGINAVSDAFLGFFTRINLKGRKTFVKFNKAIRRPGKAIDWLKMNMTSFSGALAAATRGVSVLGDALSALYLGTLRPMLVKVGTTILGLTTTIGAVVAGVGIVGSIGLLLFGPGETFFHQLEWTYDKIRAIFGLKPKTEGGRKIAMQKILSDTKVGKQDISFSVELNRLDYKSMSKPHFKVLQETGKATKKALSNLNELYIKQGKLTDLQLEELDRIVKSQKQIVAKQPEKESASVSATSDMLRDEILKVDNSKWGLTKRFFGFKPILKEADLNIRLYIRMIQKLESMIRPFFEITFNAIEEAAMRAYNKLVDELDPTMGESYRKVKEAATSESSIPGAIGGALAGGIYGLPGGLPGVVGGALAGAGGGAVLGGIYDKSIEKLLTSIRDLLENPPPTPNEMQKDLANSLDFSTNRLKSLQEDITSKDRALLEDSGSKALAATIKLRLMDIPGFTGIDQEVETWFPALRKARREAERTIVQFTALNNAVASRAETTRRKRFLSEDLTKFTDLAKSVTGIDFGKNAVNFLGNQTQMEQAERYLAKMKSYKDMMENPEYFEQKAYSKDRFKKMEANFKSFIESLNSQATVKGTIEFDSTLMKDLLPKVSFQNLRDSASIYTVSRPDPLPDEKVNYKEKLAVLMEKVRKASIDEKSISLLTSIEEVKNLKQAHIDAKKEVISFVKSTTWFEDLSERMKLARVKSISSIAYAFSDEKVLNESAKLLDAFNNKQIEIQKARLKKNKDSLKEKLQEEINLINKLKIKTSEINWSGIKEIANSNLSFWDKASNIGTLTGKPISTKVLGDEKGLEKYVKLYEELAKSQIKIKREQGSALPDSAVIRVIAKDINETEMKLNHLEKTYKLTFSRLLSTLSTTGLLISEKLFASLDIKQQKKLFSSGMLLNKMTQDISDAVSKGLVDETLSTKLEERRKQIIKIGEDLFSVYLTMGASVARALDKIGFKGLDLARIDTDDSGYKQIISDLKIIERIKLVNLNENPDTNEYIKNLSKIAKLELKISRQRESMLNTVLSQKSDINTIFKTSLDNIDITSFSKAGYAAISSMALNLKNDLEDVANNTIKGDSALAVFAQQDILEKTGVIISSLTELSTAIANSFSEGAKQGYERVNDVIKDLALTFREFANIDSETRRTLSRKSIWLTQYEKLLESPALTQEQFDILSTFGEGANLKDVLATFTTEFGIDLRSETALNTDTMKELIKVNKELVNVSLGKRSVKIGNKINEEKVITSNKPLDTSAMPKILTALVAEKQAMNTIIFADAVKAAEGFSKIEIAMKRIQFEDFTRRLQHLASPEDKFKMVELSEKIAKREDQLFKERENKDLASVRRSQLAIDEYRQAIDDLTDTISVAANIVRAAGIDFAENIKGNFSSSLSDLLKGKSDGDKSVIETFFDSILDNFTNTVVETFSESLTAKLFEKDGIISDALTSIGGGVASLGYSGLSKLGGMFSSSEAETPLADSVTSLFGTGLTDIGTDDTSLMPNYLDSFTDSIFESDTGIGEGLDMIGDDFLSDITNSFDGLTDKMPGTFDGLLSGFTGMFSKLGDMVSGMFSGGGGGWLSSLGGLFAATGGMIVGPGTNTSDSIPVMVSNREFIVNAASTKKYLPLLHAINSNSLSKFAMGGVTGMTLDRPLRMKTRNNNSMRSKQVVNVNITGDISRQTKAEIYKMLPGIAVGVNSYNKEQGM